MAGFGASQMLRLGSSLVLTRLLFPEAFGLMALVNVFLHGLQMFSDVGIGPALVRDKRGEDPVFVNTAWTLQVGRGFLLWVCASALAYPAAALFGKPALLSVIPIASLTAVVAGFNSTSLQLAKRDLRLASLTLLDLLSQAVSIGITVACALAWPTVWALVAGSLTGGLVRLVASHALLSGIQPRLHLDRESLGQLCRFGKWIFFSSAVSFLAQQGDRLLLGAYVPLTILGVYALAVNLAGLIEHTASRLAGQVLYPVLSARFRTGPERLADAFYAARARLDLLFVPAGALMAAGPWLIRQLYDERYWAAGWMVQFLAVKASCAAVNSFSGNLFVARGLPAYAFWRELLKALVACAGLPCGWYLAGMQGVLLALTLVEVPVLVLYWSANARAGLLRPLAELRSVAYLACGFAIGSLGRWLVS